KTATDRKPAGRYAQFYTKMRSKFKSSSILLIIIINFLFGILFWAVFFKAGHNPLTEKFWANESARIAGITILTLETLAIFLILKLRVVVVEKDKIIIKNLLIPFLKKERLFTYYDYSKTIDQYSKVGTYEVLWLIKNDKLEDQISSFNYSNYNKIKFEIKVKHKGKLKINSFKQLFCEMGMKI
ncbi:hypothetical protein, partial [Flavobacterium cauense]|uniref:hypothetical protein n=2 Tax=Flavobacterium cauense TaxID=510946 RepID=UPI0005547CD7